MNVPGIAGEACWFVDQGLRVRGKPVGQERIQPQRTEGASDCGSMRGKRSLAVGSSGSDGAGEQRPRSHGACPDNNQRISFVLISQRSSFRGKRPASLPDVGLPRGVKAKAPCGAAKPLYIHDEWKKQKKIVDKSTTRRFTIRCNMRAGGGVRCTGWSRWRAAGGGGRFD